MHLYPNEHGRAYRELQYKNLQLDLNHSQQWLYDSILEAQSFLIEHNSIFSKAKNPQETNSIAFFYEFHSEEINL